MMAMLLPCHHPLCIMAEPVNQPLAAPETRDTMELGLETVHLEKDRDLARDPEMEPTLVDHLKTVDSYLAEI